MELLMANEEISTFPLSLAILNSDAHSPVLFLHLDINPGNKTVSGNCELIKTKTQLSYSIKAELTGDYKYLNIIHEGNQHMVNLLGYTAYDQVCPAIKITLVTDSEWKTGKVFYEYMEAGEWLKVKDLNLKIK